MAKEGAARYLEIDLLRTLAIGSMVFYHLAFDLFVFYNIEWIDPFAPLWKLFAHAIASLFLVIVGISFILSSKKRNRREIWKHYGRRGLTVFGCGLLVTVATYIFAPESFIRFGILHCIGIAMLLLPFFSPLKEWNIPLGITLFIIGTLIGNVIPNPNPDPILSTLLLPFNLTPIGFQTLDYYPLLPWGAITLVGLGVGHFIYVRCHRQPTETTDFWRLMSVPGRYALLIYMVHQPVLIGTLAMLRILNLL